MYIYIYIYIYIYTSSFNIYIYIYIYIYILMSVLFIMSVFGMLIKESYVSSAFTEPVNQGEHIFRNTLNIKTRHRPSPHSD